MKYVSATEAKQTLGAILDQVQREPVVIRRQISALLIAHSLPAQALRKDVDYESSRNPSQNSSAG